MKARILLVALLLAGCQQAPEPPKWTEAETRLMTRMVADGTPRAEAEAFIEKVRANRANYDPHIKHRAAKRQAEVQEIKQAACEIDGC